MKYLWIIVSFFFLTTSATAKPKKHSRPKPKPVIILDAGHGGRDLGARQRSPYIEEKKVTLQAALMLKKHLTQLGYKVIMTRQTDVFLPLYRRITSANPKRSSIFVSLHFNSSPNKKAHGIEVFYYNHKKYKKRARFSKKLASSVLTNMIKATSARSRGVKNGNYYVIREAKVPSILVEGGFLTNLSERKKLKQKNYLDRLAKSIAQGVDQYFKKYKYVLGAI